jgi:hypothetical protein
VIGRTRLLARLATLFGALGPMVAGPAVAKTVVNCGGAALLGGAQLLCSHLDPRAPGQLCTFSWALATATNQTQVVQGSFFLPPGASNMEVYEGAGFVRAISGPIVVCQGQHASP